MAFTPPVDGPPPSPATDPAAAQEVGKPMPVSGLAKPMQIQGSGPDLSGVLTLGQKLVEGMLALAQAAPIMAGDIAQAKEILMTGLGKVASSAGGGNGSMPGASPTGQVVSGAGPQFPAGGQTSGRAF